MSVANTIMSQLKTRMNDILCWGFQTPQSFGADSFTDMNHNGGLIFKVNGHLHKGHVMIRLNGLDFYDIQIGKLSKGTWTCKTRMEDVFCGDMHRIIDDLVEGYYLNKEKNNKSA